MAFKAGIVAVVGRPNVGKSTLINALVGQKVSIVTSKPQTTRKSVLGIARTPHHEVVFIDTPGLHDPHTRLGKLMVDHARQSLGDADVVLFVADVSKKPGDEDKRIAQMLAGSEVPRFLCLNKMDKLPAELVVSHVEAYCKLLKCEDYMMTTATQERNLDKLMGELLERLPEGEPRFDEDAYTDQTMRFMASELIREKVLLATRQEVPHATTVLVEDWEEEEGVEQITIRAVIVVEKASQRAILIGRGGEFVKRVGTEARLEIEKLIERPVYLDLYIKVEEGWRQNPRMLHELGLDA